MAGSPAGAAKAVLSEVCMITEILWLYHDKAPPLPAGNQKDKGAR